MPTGLDLCVVSYKTPRHLSDFLSTAEEFQAPGQSTYVRINDPSDEDFAAVAPFLSSVLVDTGPNLGYAMSVNRLAAYGQNDIIGIFNADVTFDSDALAECCDALRSNEDWGVLGPRSLNSAGRVTHAGIFGTHSQPAHRGWQGRDSEAFKDIKEAVTVSGSAYFIKRSVWDELTCCSLYQDACSGLYDGNDRANPSGAFLPTDHYYEETFCSYHSAAHGHKVVYYGPSKVIHEWHQSSKVGDPLTDGKMREPRRQCRYACALPRFERD